MQKTSGIVTKPVSKASGFAPVRGIITQPVAKNTSQKLTPDSAGTTKR